MLPVSLTQHVCCQTPFAPRGLARFITTTESSDSRLRPLTGLLIPQIAFLQWQNLSGSPKFLTELSARAILLCPAMPQP